MAIEYKYGRVTTERGTIGEDEPVVIFRAQDKLLPRVMKFYAELCRGQDCAPEHIIRIEDTWRKIAEWQAAHPTLTKLPD